VMFIVWLSMFVTLALTFQPALFGKTSVSAAYNGFVTAILFFTVWFANFAEAWPRVVARPRPMRCGRQRPMSWQDG